MMAKWVVWAWNGGPRAPDDERRGALFYVEAETRGEAAELVEGMDLAALLKPGQKARVANQPAADTRNLERRP
jgi:hypothetical protein